LSERGLASARLAAWEAREHRARSAAAGTAARLLGPFPIALAVGLGAAAILGAVGASAGPAEARAWWLLLAAGAAGAVVLGAPFRMFFRADAALLARLPIPGGTLYARAARAAARAAAALGVVVLLAAVPDGLLDLARTARDLAVAAAALAAGALLAPAAGALAGALVASPRAQKAIADVTGQGSAPSTVWLALVPALGGLGVGWLTLAAAPWANHPAGAPIPLLVGLGAAALLHLGGALLARGALAAATRDVAALDRARLAHVDRTGLGPAESAFGRLACGAGPAWRLYRKDVVLARRRHPAGYILAGAGVLGMWIVAFTVASPTRERVVLSLAAGVAALAVLLAVRLASPPTERALLLATLPVPAGAARRAKAAYVAWRTVAPVLLGAAPALRGLRVAIPLAAILLGAIAAGLFVLRRPR
jgi:hypothetical protein